MFLNLIIRKNKNAPINELTYPCNVSNKFKKKKLYLPVLLS